MADVDDDFQRLHPNTRIVWTLSGLIGVCLLVVVAAVVEISVLRKQGIDMPWPPFVPVFSFAGGGALAIASVIAASMRFTRFGFRLRDVDLVVKSGVLWRSRRCIPRARIQHVDIDSGPIDRAFGVVDVAVYVAGGMGPVAQINGLSPEAAEQLKEALIVERTADGV